ncbi:hypothetical protein JCM10908_004510 [Rhodotorula pacifica]|uniref:O-fucosyltransferase family protein n=1 Tax=Rhodotorula pacifica TaxID=1495444 RepID=UPI00316C0E3F
MHLQGADIVIAPYLCLSASLTGHWTTSSSVPALQHNNHDEDVNVDAVASTSTALRMTPAIAQTPLLSGTDRARLAEQDSSSSSATSRGPSHRHNTSAALKGIGNHGKQSSWASRLSLDWTRRGQHRNGNGSQSGSTSFLPLGLFSSFAADGGTVGNNKYEPVAPMEARKKRQKSVFELDMGDFSEGLRLSTAGEGEDAEREEEDQQRRVYEARLRADGRKKRKRRKSSGAIGAFFDQFYPPTVERSRRTIERTAVIITVVLILCFFLFGGSSDPKPTSGRPTFVQKAKMRASRTRYPLRSNIPLHSFRANLKTGQGYVTSFPTGSLTTQLIEHFKLTHIGQRLDRAVVVTELKAMHGEGGDVPLTDFFDLRMFAHRANVSLVQWRDVKIPDIRGTQQEQLSCWGWKDSRALSRYNVKTDFWPYPGQLQTPVSTETSITFPGIEVLALQDNTKWLEETAPRTFPDEATRPPYPDRQLMCFDNLFYVPVVKFVYGQLDTSYSIEELPPDSAVWTKVGQHLHFNSHVNHIADELLAALIGSRRKQFIGVHIRTGNAIDWSDKTSNTTVELIDSFKVGVRAVQDQLRQRRKGHRGELPVLFTTDADDSFFLSRIGKLGWVHVNHIDFATSARFGGWYPDILDAVLLSRAVGFVGTRMSTFSHLAARRVESWNHGITTIVG